MDRDATTPLLRLFGSDGISYATYATYAQVAHQQTVRVVAINGSMPDADSYLIRIYFTNRFFDGMGLGVLPA